MRKLWNKVCYRLEMLCGSLNISIKVLCVLTKTKTFVVDQCWNVHTCGCHEFNISDTSTTFIDFTLHHHMIDIINCYYFN